MQILKNANILCFLTTRAILILSETFEETLNVDTTGSRGTMPYKIIKVIRTTTVPPQVHV